MAITSEKRFTNRNEEYYCMQSINSKILKQSIKTMMKLFCTVR